MYGSSTRRFTWVAASLLATLFVLTGCTETAEQLDATGMKAVETAPAEVETPTMAEADAQADHPHVAEPEPKVAPREATRRTLAYRRPDHPESPAASRGEAQTRAEAAPEPAAEEKAPAEPVDVTDATFNDVIEEGIVLVDFWAPWCGWCKRQTPIVNELAEAYAGKVTIAKINTDEYSEAAQRHGVRGLPTLILFKDGRRVGKFEGFRPEAYLRKVFDTLLTADAEK